MDSYVDPLAVAVGGGFEFDFVMGLSVGGHLEVHASDAGLAGGQVGAGAEGREDDAMVLVAITVTIAFLALWTTEALLRRGRGRPARGEAR